MHLQCCGRTTLCKICSGILITSNHKASSTPHYPRHISTATLTRETTRELPSPPSPNPVTRVRLNHITGPEALTYRQAADILSQAIGKKVRYDSSRENYAKFLKKVGLDADEVLELDACVANGIGDGSAVTNTIFEITQQQPIRFEQFANDYSQAFRAI